jgi:hypothetical protein
MEETAGPHVLHWTTPGQTEQRVTADGPRWFTILTLHRPLFIYVGNDRHRVTSVWLCAEDGSIGAQDACARALSMLDADNKLDLIGAEVPESGSDTVAHLRMDFVPQFRVRDPASGAWSSFCMRRPSGMEAAFVLIHCYTTRAK